MKIAFYFVSIASLVQVPVVAGATEQSYFKIKSDDSKVGGDDTQAADTHDRRVLSPITRIIGGDQAEKGQFPYYADWLGCGASLIAPDILLSAAHCNGPEPNIYVGAYRAGGKEVDGAIRRKIVKKVKHPQYRQHGFRSNYFILLKLDEPVTTIEPIGLNFDTDEPQAGDTLTVIGLGLTTDQEGSEPDILRKVDVKYVLTSECNGRSGYDGEVVDNYMFCADSCHGDSGGPIFMRDGDGKPIQVGVSSGYRMRRSKLSRWTGVYARVSGAIDWIKSEACSLSTSNPSFCDTGPPSPPPPPPTTCSQTEIIVQLKTDNYGDESSWKIKDSNNVIVASGNGYGDNKSYTETLCVSSNACKFIMRDSYGDGICCQEGNGSYSITRNGSVVHASDGKFGSKEIINICV